MIAYLEGKITYKTPTFVYLDTGGVAYHVEVSLQTFSSIEKKEEVRGYTHLQSKEDGQFLFGFYTEKERDVFRLLISVSGIGPSTAQLILSALSSDQVVHAILSEREEGFKNVKGIGAKTAKRIILDLKDKVRRTSFETGEPAAVVSNEQEKVRLEVLSALKGLGIQRAKAELLVDQILREEPEQLQLEEILKRVLKQLN